MLYTLKAKYLVKKVLCRYLLSKCCNPKKITENYKINYSPVQFSVPNLDKPKY